MRLIHATVVLALVLFPATQGGAARPDKMDKEPSKAEQVAKLIGQLQTDPDSGRRARAAEELRDFDARQFPEIPFVLIEALQKDTHASVRREAAQSLGRLKPTSMEALKALEEASGKDLSSLVRLQARTARIGYRVREPKGTEGPLPLPASREMPSPARPPTPAVMPSSLSLQPSKALPKPGGAMRTSAKPPLEPAQGQRPDGPILIAPPKP